MSSVTFFSGAAALRPVPPARRSAAAARCSAAASPKPRHATPEAATLTLSDEAHACPAVQVLYHPS